MSTNFPNAKDVLNNPTAGVTYEDDSGYSHSAEHSNANDAIEALEDKVGIDSSTDHSSLDYKVTKLIADVAALSGAATLASVYPVGSLYINAAVPTNPATLFGFGTWVAHGTGRVLVGVDATQTEFNTLGKTGGVKTVDLSHIHVVSNHTHTYSGSFRTGLVAAWQTGNEMPNSPQLLQRNHDHWVDVTGTTSGSTPSTDSRLSNVQSILTPYTTVYIWKRTA